MKGTDVSDFNLRLVSLYSSHAFLVAARFYDLAPNRWDKLSCIWYARNGFFELKDDRYLTDTMVRFKSVDALVAEKDPEMTATAKHLYDQWLGIKARLAKQRSDDPIKIDPPKPVPTPLPIPDPIPEPKKPEPVPEAKKNPPAALVKFSVWFGIAGMAITAASLFFPQLKMLAPFVALIKALLGAFGA
jgi:hypothetical protein